VSFQSVLVAQFLSVEKAFNMFPASVDHLLISMMLQAVWFVAGFEPQGYLFESELTQVSVSLSKLHHTPPNVEEG